MSFATDRFLDCPLSGVSYGRFFDPPRRALDRLAHHMAVARSRKALLELDDRLLADVGLDRGAAAAEGRKGFGR